MEIERARERAELRAKRNAGLDAQVERVVLEHFTRDAEFVARRLPVAAPLNAVRESIRRQAVIRALRGLPVLSRRRAEKRVVYSNIVAGRYVRDCNYACRLFQFDLVRVPSLALVPLNLGAVRELPSQAPISVDERRSRGRANKAAA